MVIRAAATALMGLALVTTLSAQAARPGAPKSVVHDITITADEVYTGTIEMAVDSGKVTGKMRITVPTDVTGDVAGTSKAGVLELAFPFHMTESGCDGTVKMNITLASAPAPSKGTMEAVGCGREESNKLTGTVEIKPADPKARGGA